MTDRLYPLSAGLPEEPPDLGQVDLAGIRAAVQSQARRPTPGIEAMSSYLDAQNRDDSHRDVLGPLGPGTGASGLVVHRGWVLAQWGEVDAVEMAFSATKSILSLVAGLAFDDGLLRLDARVGEALQLDELRVGDPDMTWRHLLQQTSGWPGELWGKPAAVDAQSKDGGGWPTAPAGAAWAYNDVRVNLLALAVTALFGRPLDEVLRERVMDRLDASSSWSWHGYANSVLRRDGRSITVVSGGAHWGGGLWISARDLALIGELYARGGSWAGRRLISRGWLDATWSPTAVKPEYGLLWWRNEGSVLFRTAPATGRFARGNGGRHLLWIDPARQLVICSRWGEDVEVLLADVSTAISPGAATRFAAEGT